ITLLLALIPAVLGYYANYKEHWILSLLCYLGSVFVLTVPMGAYVMVKLVQHCMPIILRILGLLNKRLMPIARSISHTKIIGPLINLFIRTQFFFWFVGLMMCDQLIRIVLGRFAGQHTTHRYLFASKLAYEDVAVVKYELALAGYDVENTFKAIGYKHKPLEHSKLCD
ncbi:hypothetical protein CU098_003237, partial [Rhizopus stolonifer]